MLKRILSFSFIAVVIFLIACTSKEDPQMTLTKKLEKSTNGEILKTYYDDFDNDGKKEMFALVGELVEDNQFETDIADGQVWFASENMMKRVDDGNHGMGIVIVGDNAPTTVEYDNGSLFMFKSIWGNGEITTSVCTAQTDDISVTTIPGSLTKGENGWKTTTSTYDCIIENDKFDKEEYYGSGRSWKNYWYHLNEQSGEFKEYAAKEITIDQFANFNGSYDILSDIDDEIHNILYRENGIININVINNDIIGNRKCTNILVGYEGNSVWAIDNQHFSMPFDYHSMVYDGIYLPALTPNLANYPPLDFASTLPTENPVNISTK